MRNARLDPVLVKAIANASTGELRWYTVPETAQLCKRAVSTIHSLVSHHRLPIRRGWTVRNRARRRTIMLSGPMVELLQSITIFASTQTQQRETGNALSQPVERGRALEEPPR